MSEKELKWYNWHMMNKEMYRQYVEKQKKQNAVSRPKRPPRPYDYSKADRYTTGLLYIPKKQMVSCVCSIIDV